MGQRISAKSSAGHDQDLHTTLVIWGTIADTSLRLFVPVIGLTLLGYACDKLWGTRPVLIIGGMSLGVVLAVLLVVSQYRQVTKEPRV